MAIGPTIDNLARRRAEEASLLDALVAQETAAQRAAMQPFASRPMSRDAASGTLASIAALEAAQARGELGPTETRSLAEMRLLAPLAGATMGAQPNYTEMPSNALRGLLDIGLTADMTVDDALRYYLGPTGIPDRLASLTQMADPGVYDAGYSAADLIDPRTSPEERRMAGQTVATTVAMAPLAFVGADDWARASLPDVGLGAATQRARERVGEFMADETGALMFPKSVRGLFDEATLREGMIDVPDDPNAREFFADALRRAQASHGPIGRSVDVYTPDEYAGMRMAMTPEADAGFVVKPDGEIASVVKNKASPFRDFSGAVLRRAEPDNGYWLNAFDTALTGLYGRGGFRPVSRLPFSEEVARGSWGDEATDAFMAANAQYNGGRPDLVFMARNPSDPTPVVQGSGGLLTDDWDYATQLLDDELKRLGYRR